MANEPQTAPAQNQNDPIVEVGGVTYHLRGLSVADANRIYGALPADYQRMADQYAQVAQLYETTLRLNLPPGITPAKALQALAAAPRTAQGTLEQTVAPYLKDIERQLRQEMPNDTRVLSDGLAFLIGLGTGASSLLMALPRMIDTGSVVVREVGGSLTPGMSADQAKAFGTVFAASMFYEGAVRQNMEMAGWNPFAKEKTLLWSHLPESVAAGFDYATMHWPLVKDVWPYIEASWKFLGQWVAHLMDKTKPEPDFDTILNEVKQKIAVREMGDTSWRGLTEGRLRDGDRAAAGRRVASAGTIAGADITELTQIATNGGAIIDNRGITQTITPNGNGGLDTNPVTGPNGQPVTRMDRVGESASNILGEAGKAFANASAADIFGVGVGGSLAGYGIVKVTPPVARTLVGAAAVVGRTGAKAVGGVAAAVGGVASVTTNSAVAMAGGKEQAALQEAEARAATLWRKQTMLEAEKLTAEKALADAKAAQAAGANGSWWDRFKLQWAAGSAQGDVNRMSGALKANEEAILGKTAKTWFGLGAARHVESADDLVARARAAAEAAPVFAPRVAVAEEIGQVGQRTSGFINTTLERLRILDKGQTVAEAAPRVFGAARWVAEKLPMVSGAYAGAQTAGNLTQGDLAGVTIRGTETAAIVGTIAKLGASRAFAPVAGVVEGADFASSVHNGDTRGVVGSATALGTMGAGALAGAGIGAAFGGVGAIPGAAIGFAWGGIASIATKWGAEAVYDRVNTPKPPVPPAAEPAVIPQRDGAAGNANPQLAEANVQAMRRAQQAANTRAARDAAGTIESSQTAAAALPLRVLPGVQSVPLQIN